MRITLVYQGRYHLREALDLETLAAILRAQGHHVSFIYHPNVFGITDNVFQCAPLSRFLSNEKRIQDRILSSRPDALIFSVLAQTHEWCHTLAESLKQRIWVPIIFTGLYPSLTPERGMERDAVDYIIQGEVEDVILPLLESLDKGKDPVNVGNLWYRRDNAPVFTHRQPLVNLDNLPLPDKELFFPHISHAYSYSAMVSRGCPFHCSFCEETCMKKVCGSGYFRRKRVDTILMELEEGKQRYGFREVIFKDSYLSGDRAWLSKLMEGYARRIGVPFKCFCTVTAFDRETASLLKEGGCYSVEFGLQTWNETLRREVLNRKESNEDALRAFGYCREMGLWYDVDHMFDLPKETARDHLDGARRYAQLPHLGRIKVHHLVYLPTAEIVRHGQQSGDLPFDIPNPLSVEHACDFYQPRQGIRSNENNTSDFAALYKILPLLPQGLLEWFLRKRRVQWLSRMPAIFMASLQGANALRCGDLRFLAYLHFYPRKVLMSLLLRHGFLRSRTNQP